MGSILGSEFRPLDQSHQMIVNDQELRRAISAVYSRNSFAINTQSITSSGVLDYRTSIAFCNPSGGSITVTLSLAAYWGTSKSPMVTIIHVGGTSNTVTVATSGSDTIDGKTSLVVYEGGEITLVSDGSSKWYAVRDHVRHWYNIMDFGAVADADGAGGGTDCSAAFERAIDNTPAGSIIYIPPGRWRLATGITMPANKTLMGMTYGFIETQGNVDLVADLNVATVVTIQAASGASGGLQNLSINRSSGAVPANSIGLLIDDNRYTSIENVQCYNHEVGIKCSGSLGVKLTHVNTTKITGTHLWFDDNVQADCINVICGRDGGGDVVCNQYIRISGSSCDTLRFSHCQFNLSGADTVDAERAIFIDTYSDADGLVSFTNCHFERVGIGTANGAGDNAIIYQSGTTLFPRLSFNQCTFGTDVASVFFDSGVPANFIKEFVLVNSPFVVPQLNLTAADYIAVTGNHFNDDVIIDDCKGAYVANTHKADLTLQGTMVGLTCAANEIDGTFTDTSNGSKSVYGNVYANSTTQKTMPSRFEQTAVRTLAHDIVNVTYSNSMTFNAQDGNIFVIVVTDGNAWTLNAPTNPTTGQIICVRVANTSGGAMGLDTWNGAFKKTVFTPPATGYSRTLWFYYNSVAWVEIGRTAADIPN